MSGEVIAKDMDSWDSTIDGIPYGLYLYYIDDSRFITDATSILGNCSAIQTVQYTPFLEPGLMTAWNIPYDVQRFGKPDSNRPMLDSVPNVFRIIDYPTSVRQIGTFPTYDIQGLTLGGVRNWRNESRLYNYPYSFALLTDYLNPPMTVKYHLCRRVDNQKVMVKQTISDRCSYGLFIEDYKNDTTGKMEAIVSGDAHELPCTSSAYSQWFASSKNQTRFAVNQGVQESFLQQRQGIESSQMSMLSSTVGGLMGTIGGFMGGGLAGGAMSGGYALGNTIMNGMTQNMNQSHMRQNGAMQRQGLIGANLAMQKDLRSTPNTLLSMGSDVMYGLKNGEKRVDLIRYMLTEEYARRIGDYFAMYGYKQNKLMPIDKRNRKYYNYIKTIGINFQTFGIPKDHVEQLKQIYNNGVTIWHVDREGVIVGDYSKDNVEV